MMNKQPTDIKSNIKKDRVYSLLDVMTIKEEKIAIIEKNRKKLNELSSIYKVYLI